MFFLYLRFGLQNVFIEYGEGHESLRMWVMAVSCTNRFYQIFT